MGNFTFADLQQAFPNGEADQAWSKIDGQLQSEFNIGKGVGQTALTTAQAYAGSALQTAKSTAGGLLSNLPISVPAGVNQAYDYAKEAAQQTLANTFDQLTTNVQGVVGADAMQYATDFTMAAKTVGGAVQTISSIIAATKGATTPEGEVRAVNMCLGTLMAVATAAGMASGYGALIIALVEVAIEVLELAGALGPTTPPIATLCGNIPLNFQPTILIGCSACNLGKVNAPNAGAWRKFPDPSKQTDAPWFTNYVTHIGGEKGVTFQWGDAAWTAGIGPEMGGSTFWYYANHGGLDLDTHTPYNIRPIDAAFPYYYLVEQAYLKYHGTNTWLDDFLSAYFIMWKANAEFGFNGQAVQPDWALLLHMTRVWNAAHDGSTYFDMTPGSLFDSHYAGVTDLAHNLQQTDAAFTMVNGNLRINTGPRYQVPIPPFSWTTNPSGNIGALTASTAANAAVLFSALAKIFPGMTLLQIEAAVPLMRASGVPAALWATLSPAQKAQLKASGITGQLSTTAKIAIVGGGAVAGGAAFAWYSGLSAVELLGKFKFWR